MKRTLTSEQQLAAQERRAAMRKLARQIGAMLPDERLALANRVANIVTVEGRTLSMHNMCMAASQNPSATIVGGFRQWIKAGRAVRKGEHGIAIWVPIKPRDNGETEHAEGEPDEIRFLLGTVFDVSQTDEIQTPHVD